VGIAMAAMTTLSPILFILRLKIVVSGEVHLIYSIYFGSSTAASREGNWL
jgi:hypothetical protein